MKPPTPKKGPYLRREWRIEKETPEGNKQNYTPSHHREGFSEQEVEVLPPVVTKKRWES